MVERALHARAERLADIERRDHRHWDRRHCYASGSEPLAPFADDGSGLCVNRQELVSARRDHRGC